MDYHLRSPWEITFPTRHSVQHQNGTLGATFTFTSPENDGAESICARKCCQQPTKNSAGSGVVWPSLALGSWCCNVNVRLCCDGDGTHEVKSYASSRLHHVVNCSIKRGRTCLLFLSRVRSHYICSNTSTHSAPW